MEKRRFSRVPFRTMATITTSPSGICSTGEVKNISMAGLLATMDKDLKAGTQVQVDIRLIGGDPALVIDVNGTIVRNDGENTAIRFDLSNISLDALCHLRHLVGNNLGDEDRVMNEYFLNLQP